ncbi:hypothetical protein A5747_03650 [Mycobacterium sp. IS-836]|nr:hypothetical protein A5736_10880 [Mycobacterium sp. SP-6446]OMC57466.1 hypothetical protein A5747_03650 [Mycobacterium sp. IS-836]
MGPSHLLITGPPYWQPALAGGAAAISPPAISAAPRPAMKADFPRDVIVNAVMASPLGYRDSIIARIPRRASLAG